MSQFLTKLTKYIPLWQRHIPPYPVYWKGNPQLRVYLPLFWMKMVKPEENFPHDSVLFEVHHQMTKYDVKNYLEKIYGVKVLSVTCTNERGEVRHHPKFGFDTHPDRDRRLAVVQLEGKGFTFPEMFKGKDTEETKTTKELEKVQHDNKRLAQKQWSRMDLPPWFR